MSAQGPVSPLADAGNSASLFVVYLHEHYLSLFRSTPPVIVSSASVTSARTFSGDTGPTERATKQTDDYDMLDCQAAAGMADALSFDDACVYMGLHLALDASWRQFAGNLWCVLGDTMSESGQASGSLLGGTGISTSGQFEAYHSQKMMPNLMRGRTHGGNRLLSPEGVASIVQGQKTPGASSSRLHGFFLFRTPGLFKLNKTCRLARQRYGKDQNSRISSVNLDYDMIKFKSDTSTDFHSIA